MRWLSVEVVGVSKLVLVYCRQKHPGSRKQWHGTICSPVQERSKSCAGLGNSQSHLPSQPPSLTCPCSVPGSWRTCGWSTPCRVSCWPAGQGCRLGARLAYRKCNRRYGPDTCQVLCITQTRAGMLSQDCCILVPEMLRAKSA